MSEPIATAVNMTHVRQRLNQSSFRNKLSDRIFQGVVIFFSTLMIVPLVLIIAFIAYQGVAHLSLALFVQDERNGGILNAIVGSVLMVAFSTLITVPIAVLTGMYLSNNRKSGAADAVRLIVDILQGVPSIMVGIIIYVWMVEIPQRNPFAFAGSIALSIMMLPTVIKNTEESLKLIPISLKEAAYALGAPSYQVMLQIVLPAGLSGVLTGVLVGVSRVLGETAPLLYTAGTNRDLTFNMGLYMQSLPTLIFTDIMTPSDETIATAWAASFILVVFVLVLNLTTKIATRRWKVTF